MTSKLKKHLSYLIPTIISITIIIITAIILLNNSPRQTQNQYTHAQLICPTSNSERNSLQLIGCTIPTPTLTPEPTIATHKPPSQMQSPECAQILNNTSPPIGQPTTCSGTPVSFRVPKKLIPIGGGRPGKCVTPPYIVMHTTASTATAEGIYQYFYNGADGRRVATQFIVGNNGEIIQTTETLDTQVEVAYGVLNYPNTIGLELTKNGIYQNKTEVPPAQYKASLCLVKALMKQYNIPIGEHDHNWSSPDIYHHNYPKGIYGHYQLNPGNRTDPGKGFLRDFRADLATMP